jgi:hypothetical protein
MANHHVFHKSPEGSAIVLNKYAIERADGAENGSYLYLQSGASVAVSETLATVMDALDCAPEAPVQAPASPEPAQAPAPVQEPEQPPQA